MRTLVLVRHGETVGNSSVRYYGRTDLELSGVGRAQMREARRWLRRRFGEAGFSAVFSSPLCRAVEGAAIIAGQGCPITNIEEFVEVDFGCFEGLTRQEIQARFPEEFLRWDRDRLDPGFTYPRGESRADFTGRVHRGIQLMLEVIGNANAGADAVALLVAHRGVIRTITTQLGGIAPVIELGSIQILHSEGSSAGWRTELVDAVEHLAGMD